MENDPRGKENYTFIRLAQYLAGLTSQQDVWSEVGKALISFFNTDVVAFGKRGVEGEIVTHDWAFSKSGAGKKWSQAMETLGQADADYSAAQPEITEAISETFESGFLSRRTVSKPSTLSLAFLPINQESQVSEVMMVGYGVSEPFSKKSLDIYLAVAGLIGTTAQRLASEKELGEYRRRLEKLVMERTARLTESNNLLQNEIVQRKRAEEEKEALISDLQKALQEVKKLSGLLPICSFCKKIRDDKGYWNQIETYIRDHSEAEFSHGVCQECAKKYYPDMKIFDDD